MEFNGTLRLGEKFRNVIKYNNTVKYSKISYAQPQESQSVNDVANEFQIFSGTAWCNTE